MAQYAVDDQLAFGVYSILIREAACSGASKANFCNRKKRKQKATNEAQC